MEKWRGEIQGVFDGVVLSAGADASSEPFLYTAGRETELGPSRSPRRYYRSTESGSEVVSAGQWYERGCARIVHLYEDPHKRGRHFVLHYGDMTDSSSLVRIVQPVQVLVAAANLARSAYSTYQPPALAACMMQVAYTMSAWRLLT